MSDESAAEVSGSPNFRQDPMLALTKRAVVDSRTAVLDKEDSSDPESVMVLHLGQQSNCVAFVDDDNSHKPTSEKLLVDMGHTLTGALEEIRQEDTEIQNKNFMYFADNVSVLKPTFSSTDVSPGIDDNNFCTNSTGNNNKSDFQLPVSNTGSAVFKKQTGNIMSSPSILRHMKGPSATSMETELMVSKRNLPGHEMSLGHVQMMESLPLLSNIGEVHDKAGYARKKYVYPVTSVGKGESSV
jgi:hypothetical protein